MVADLEALEHEIQNATAPARAQAERDGEALKASLEAYAQKVDATITPNATAPLEKAVENAFDRAEDLANTVEAATIKEQNAIESAGEALRNSIMAAEAAEEAVLESHRAEFEAAADEIEEGLNEVGEWLEGEFEELEGDLQRVNLENLQTPHVAMIKNTFEDDFDQLADFEQELEDAIDELEFEAAAEDLLYELEAAAEEAHEAGELLKDELEEFEAELEEQLLIDEIVGFEDDLSYEDIFN